ncbi:hypothetical protein [[Flexibacter] sp. ATCC 35208]|uniref:hypothetical protein n=1 Tax=[Flexibacter] sp. ATCC 35208 TaxID=1936242 RepID=UPI0009D2CBDD|nr:hypothetical protein [[Flexibacter] sp. ATCC 35208]OMP75504.1 hypothetical protein BW716_29790 [[Flexibacter] sp. ATCC 35208]
MERKDSFGVHFVLRRMKSGNNYIYARVVVNGTISELGPKQEIAANRWNYDCIIKLREIGFPAGLFSSAI